MVQVSGDSVGPLQPETVGLAEGRFLCIFLRKYISCVLTIGGGRRYSAVGLSAFLMIISFLSLSFLSRAIFWC